MYVHRGVVQPLHPEDGRRCADAPARRLANRTSDCVARLARRLGQIALATTTPRLGRERQHARSSCWPGPPWPWATTTTQASGSRAWWRSAPPWAPWWHLDAHALDIHPRDPAGHCDGLLLILMVFISNILGSPSVSLILLGGLGGYRGGAHERAAAAPGPQPDGRGSVDCRAELQRSRPASWGRGRSSLSPNWACVFGAITTFGLVVAGIMGHPLAPAQLREPPRRGEPPAGYRAARYAPLTPDCEKLRGGRFPSGDVHPVGGLGARLPRPTLAAGNHLAKHPRGCS